MIQCKLNGQWDIILPKHRADRPEWYTETGWERKRLEKLHEVITDKDVFYYVGSEEGDMPALCHIWGAKMVLFEPNPKVWSNTKAIWEANKLETPMTFQGFCSTKTKVIDPVNGFNKGWPTCADDEIIAAHGFKELDKESQTYNQIRIDDVAKQYLPPTIIALDVEGSEGHVLRGAEQTLREYKPKIFLSLHPEFMQNSFNESSDDLRDWLKSLGYTESLIEHPAHEWHYLYE